MEASHAARAEQALGHLYWRQNRMDEAVSHFSKAVALKPEGWQVYWDFARLAHNSAPASEILAALDRTVSLNPELIDARMMLGFEQYRAKRYGSAFVTLRGLKQMKPEHAAQVFLAMAHSAIRLNRVEDAKLNAAKAKKYAKNAADETSAEQLLVYLNSQKGGELAAFEAPIEQTAAVSQRDEYQVAQGVLEEVVCAGGKAKLVVKSGTKQFTLLLRTPEMIAIKNSESATVEMKCGPQHGARVSVEFLENADAGEGTSGDVTSLEFLDKK
ncbi:MAG: hypothetical protein WKF37_09350 [Bryobacteraceae bacterium]